MPVEEAVAGAVVAMACAPARFFSSASCWVNQHEAELKKHGKNHEFHRYDGAGHGFFYRHRPLYRPEQAMDGWNKVFAFFGKHLAKEEAQHVYFHRRDRPRRGHGQAR